MFCRYLISISKDHEEKPVIYQIFVCHKGIYRCGHPQFMSMPSEYLQKESFSLACVLVTHKSRLIAWIWCALLVFCDWRLNFKRGGKDERAMGNDTVNFTVTVTSAKLAEYFTDFTIHTEQLSLPHQQDLDCCLQQTGQSRVDHLCNKNS